MPTASPRFGQISFINSLPVVLPIEHKHVKFPAKFHYGEPTALNSAIEEDRLDVSAISSFYYLQNDSLVLIPGISISCLYEVGSVLLFSKTDPGQLGGATILVPGTSATSVALLKILLAEKFGVSAQLVREQPADSFDAACLFGDEALASDTTWSENYKRYDLGSWWYELTGLPMVFALWATTRTWHTNNPQSINEISSTLQKAVKLGLGEKFNDVVAEAYRRSGIFVPRLAQYYKKQLNYELADKHFEGLDTFRRLCVKHGLLAAK